MGIPTWGCGCPPIRCVINLNRQPHFTVSIYVGRPKKAETRTKLNNIALEWTSPVRSLVEKEGQRDPYLEWTYFRFNDSGLSNFVKSTNPSVGK